jgi:hypothetical protein
MQSRKITQQRVKPTKSATIIPTMIRYSLSVQLLQLIIANTPKLASNESSLIYLTAPIVLFLELFGGITCHNYLRYFSSLLNYN